MHIHSGWEQHTDLQSVTGKASALKSCQQNLLYIHNNPWFWSYICVNSNRLNFSLRSTNIHPPKFQQPRPPLKSHDDFFSDDDPGFRNWGRWCFNFFSGGKTTRYFGTTSKGGPFKGTSKGGGSDTWKNHWVGRSMIGRAKRAVHCCWQFSAAWHSCHRTTSKPSLLDLFWGVLD